MYKFLEFLLDFYLIIHRINNVVPKRFRWV